jgi:predicted GTPase
MTTENLQKLVLVSPLSEPVLATSTLAPRLASLHGKRIGLFDNSKNRAAQLLDAVAAMLEAQYGCASVMCHRKPSASKPAAPEVLAEFARTCDLVLVGVGD